MKIQMIVAAHKAYRMPQDPMYIPIHVGKAGKELELGFQGDNTGDNISEKNFSYCELTGLYWAWKHLDGDYIGLSHYRRYFRGKSGKNKWDCILTQQQAERYTRDMWLVSHGIAALIVTNSCPYTDEQISRIFTGFSLSVYKSIKEIPGFAENDYDRDAEFRKLAEK